MSPCLPSLYWRGGNALAGVGGGGNGGRVEGCVEAAGGFRRGGLVARRGWGLSLPL